MTDNKFSELLFGVKKIAITGFYVNGNHIIFTKPIKDRRFREVSIIKSKQI